MTSDIFTPNEDKFIEAIKYNNLNKCQQIFKQYPEIKSNFEKKFYRDKYIQYYVLNKKINNIHWLFQYSCNCGHLSIAQWLLQIQPNIKISSNKEQTFRNICIHGHLHIAQWLLYVKPTIDISAENDYAFRYACQYGHLQVAQWLLSIKPDISIICII